MRSLRIAPVDRVRRRLDALPPRPCWRPLDRLEAPVLDFVGRVRLSGPADRATAVLTRAGEHGLIWYAAAEFAARIDEPRRRRWRQASLAVAVSYLAGSALKIAARRARPRAAAIETETALSFPSLHAATSFAAARTFSALAPLPPARLAVYAAALAVTASRLHFAVHYPSDLLAGAALGDVVGRATVSRWRREDAIRAALAGAPAPLETRR